MIKHISAQFHSSNALIHLLTGLNNHHRQQMQILSQFMIKVRELKTEIIAIFLYDLLADFFVSFAFSLRLASIFMHNFMIFLSSREFFFIYFKIVILAFSRALTHIGPQRHRNE
jgi:hypothetical protein